MASDIHSVLVVTKDIKTSTLISAMLVPPMFDVILAEDFNEARRLCTERVFNIVIVDFADDRRIIEKKMEADIFNVGVAVPIGHIPCCDRNKDHFAGKKIEAFRSSRAITKMRPAF